MMQRDTINRIKLESLAKMQGRIRDIKRRIDITDQAISKARLDIEDYERQREEYENQLKACKTELLGFFELD